MARTVSLHVQIAFLVRAVDQRIGELVWVFKIARCLFPGVVAFDEAGRLFRLFFFSGLEPRQNYKRNRQPRLRPLKTRRLDLALLGFGRLLALPAFSSGVSCALLLM